MLRAAVADALMHPEVETVFATVHPDHPASIRVLEKGGFMFERALPEKDRLLYRLDRPAG